MQSLCLQIASEDFLKVRFKSSKFSFTIYLLETQHTEITNHDQE